MTGCASVAARFEVVGIAVTVAFPSYPDSLGSFLVGSLGSYSMGLVWVPEADVAQLAAAGSEPVFYYLDLKLADPATARAFVDRFTTGSSSQQTSGPSAAGGASTSPTTLTLYSWQLIRSEDVQLLARAQLVLYTGSWLLVLLALASVAVLVGGRMAEQTRRVGLLKAVGGTPRFVAVVLLCEHVLVGLCAAAVGLLAGWLAAPLIDGPGAGLLGAPNAPSLTFSSVGLVVALALGVAIAATFVPAIRAARQSTVAALDDSARAPRRRVARDQALGSPASNAPARHTACRSSSASAAAERVQRRRHGERSRRPADRQDDRRRCVPRSASDSAITVISVMLVVLAAINAVFIAWSSALEARRPAALARALGATPAQITIGLSVALLLPALLRGATRHPGRDRLITRSRSTAAARPSRLLCRWS